MDAVLEFPFAAALPVQSEDDSALPRAERARRRLSLLKAMVASKGLYVPVALTAEILGVSVQRVHDIVRQGHLEKVQVHALTFITESSLVEYVHSERRNGRPPSLPKTVTEMARLAAKFGRES
jgi:hypothetical protein